MSLNFPSLLEMISLIFSIIATLLAALTWLYNKTIKPITLMIESHDRLLHNVEAIKKEVQTNTGSSLKDAIYDLKSMCQRMEDRQIILDNRSRAILYGLNEAVFETDEKGNIVWANENFYKKLGKSDLIGLDWISYIDEVYRDSFLHEFQLCLNQNRELKFNTMSMDGANISFLGFPYREENKSNQGFLIYLISA